jgi:hypothetical protein
MLPSCPQGYDEPARGLVNSPGVTDSHIGEDNMHLPSRKPILIIALAMLFNISGVAAAQDNTNSTIQVGKVNINRTTQCGETNTNATYQEGKVNINQTSQGGCGGPQNPKRQGHGTPPDRTDQGRGRPAHAAAGQRW